MKTKLWEQTEEAFPYLRMMNGGSAAEKTLAYDLLSELLSRVISPVLRGRIAAVLRKYTQQKKSA